MDRLRHVYQPVRLWNLWARNCPSILRRKDFVPFVLLSRSRTGSNLLASYLNSHPRIHVEGEILGRLDGKVPEAVLNRVYGPQSWHIRAKGFKLFYYHPMDGSGDQVRDLLLAVPGLRVVQLRRRNLLRVLVSRKLAERSQEWVSRGPSTEQVRSPIEISAVEAEEDFVQTRRWEEEAREVFRSHPMLDVLYEELAASPAAVLERVAALLGLVGSAPRTAFRRQNPQPLNRLVENYDELRSAFVGTPWIEFFDDVS